MDSVRKKLIIPFFIFLGMMVVNLNSLIRGIEKHEAWRIAVASAAFAVLIALALVVGIQLSKMKKEEAGLNK
ncbi:MAG: hypothetical protein ACHQHN_10550 [Sphingobacteriales bacterium]